MVSLHRPAMKRARIHKGQSYKACNKIKILNSDLVTSKYLLFHIGSPSRSWGYKTETEKHTDFLYFKMETPWWENIGHPLVMFVFCGGRRCWGNVCEIPRFFIIGFVISRKGQTILWIPHKILDGLWTRGWIVLLIPPLSILFSVKSTQIYPRWTFLPHFKVCAFLGTGTILSHWWH